MAHAKKHFRIGLLIAEALLDYPNSYRIMCILGDRKNSCQAAGAASGGPGRIHRKDAVYSTIYF